MVTDSVVSVKLWRFKDSVNYVFKFVICSKKNAIKLAFQDRPLKRLNPTGHVMHHQFNIQQLYALPTLYLCVLYLSESKQRLVPLTVYTDWFL